MNRLKLIKKLANKGKKKTNIDLGSIEPTEDDLIEEAYNLNKGFVPVSEVEDEEAWYAESMERAVSGSEVNRF